MHCITVGLGYSYALSNVEDIDFDSKASILGNDVVLFDLSRAQESYREFPKRDYDGLPHLNENGASFARDIHRRKREVDELLLGGGTVIVFTPADLTVYVNKRDQTGASKGQVLVEQLNPLSILPTGFRSEANAGKRIVTNAPEPFRTFFATLNGKLKYDGTLTHLPATSTILATIASTRMAVAAHLKVGAGNLLVLPRSAETLRFDPDGELIPSNPYKYYFAALLALVEALKSDRSIEPQPDWLANILVPGESEAIQQVEAAQVNLSAAEAKLITANNDLIAAQRIKRLLYTEGGTLEDAVAECFAELGFTIHESEANRVDILASIGKKFVAIEVKGLLKSATEANAAELEKWVMSHNDGEGPRPKGILVVNAFRRLPLHERKADAFPHQMLRFSEVRAHCLITTTQLLNLILDIRQHAKKTPEKRKQLLKTEGRFKGDDGLNEFLKNRNS